MKTKQMIALVAAGLMTAGSAFAQGTGAGDGGCGKNYGGPPKTEEERAARKAQCQQENGGTCEQQGQCEGKGKGQGQGQGKGQRKGGRHGGGARGGNGAVGQ